MNSILSLTKRHTPNNQDIVWKVELPTAYLSGIPDVYKRVFTHIGPITVAIDTIFGSEMQVNVHEGYSERPPTLQ